MNEIRMPCKICGELKIRQHSGYFPGSKNKKYVDENGLLWNGKTCPQCVVVKARLTMRKNRFKEIIKTRETIVELDEVSEKSK